MLVAVEGIDGSGKSTLAKNLARALRREGRNVILTQEPTKTWLGRAVRKGIRSHLDPLALAALFLADRAAHAATLRPPLRKGTLVITDRYTHSTTAYQAAALASSFPGALESLHSLQAHLFPRPDVVLWADLSPKKAVQRLAGRKIREPFEKVRFLTKVRANYARLAALEPDRWVRLDATKAPAQVEAAALRAVHST